MMKISVVIITYNEEKNIARCIESVQNVADEIIVLDSFSTDNTKKICSNFQVNFVQHKFDGHIQQKNRAAKLANFNLILSLDADEALSDELKKSILKIKENPQFDGYYFNRLTYYCGKWIKHSGWYPDRKLRLWKKGKAQWGGVNPHDKVIMQPSTTQKFLEGDLLHYSFYSIEQHIEQINKFSTIKAVSAYEKNKKTNLVKIIFKPPVKFFIQYILKLGILDGFLGFVVCKNSAHAEFLKQIKLQQLYKNAK